jgi:hypothetical protein
MRISPLEGTVGSRRCASSTRRKLRTKRRVFVLHLGFGLVALAVTTAPAKEEAKDDAEEDEDDHTTNSAAGNGCN